MSINSGLDLTEDGDDFILVVTAADDTVSRVRLTEDQVMAICQSAPLFLDKIALRHSPEGADVSAVVVTPVAQIAVRPSSLGDMVLLTLQSSTRGLLTFGLPPHIVRLMLEHLPLSLAEIEETKMTK